MKSAEQKAKKVPAIRFTGFDDEWEKLSFADVGNVCMCKRVFKEETSDKGDIPFYKIGTFGGIPDAYITKELYNEYRTKFSYPEKGDILLSAAGTIGRIVEYDGESAYFQDSNIVWLSHDKSITNKFLKVLYSTLKWGGIEGSTIQRLYNDIFLKTSFFKPTISEQQKIGSFFSNIDSLISLEQKKYDKLTQVKKSMLEKMFPKEGATVPEIRFAGFSSDWKKKKLSDEFVDFIVPMRDKPKSFDGKIPWTRIEDIEGKFLNSSLSGQYVSEKTIAQMNLKVIPKNSLIVSSSATFGVVAVVTQDLITNQTFIGLVPNDKESLDFWYIFFYSDKAREYMKSQSAGSTIFYIARESFENMPVMIPSREEQQKIGSYFSHLDSLIALQQRKLEKLKNIKKSLLEKMFV